MTKTFAFIAALLCAPMLAHAATVTPGGVDNLSAAPYHLSLPLGDYGGEFTLGFEADGVLPYAVSGTFDLSLGSGGSFAPSASFGFDNGTVFTNTTGPQDFAFTVQPGDTVTLTIMWSDGLTTSKDIGLDFSLEATPVPVPAGLPLLASGIAAVGIIRRRRRAKATV